MGDDQRFQRLGRCHALCLSAADKFPNAQYIAMRSDDEILDQILNGTFDENAFPVALFDMDWSECHQTGLSLAVIADHWLYWHRNAPAEIAAVIESYVSQTVPRSTSEKPIERMRERGYALSTRAGGCSDNSGFWVKNNLRKFVFDFFWSRHCRWPFSSTSPSSGALILDSFDFQGKLWVGRAFGSSASTRDSATRQWMAIREQWIKISVDLIQDFRLAKIGRAPQQRRERSEVEWLERAFELLQSSVVEDGSVEVCRIEENFFLMLARTIEFLCAETTDFDFETEFTPAELAQKLQMSPDTLSRYATQAEVKRPGRGDREHRYQTGDIIKICNTITGSTATERFRQAARELLKELTGETAV